MIKDIKELNFPAYATLETATATISDMGDRTITSQVKIDGDVVPDFSYDWEVEFKGERYIHPVKTPQGTKDNTSRKSKIDLVFQHWAIYEMKRQYFVEMASTTAGTAIADKYIASLGLNLGDFVTAFNLVLNHYFEGRIIIKLNPEWQYNPEAKFVSISYSYIWDVLQQMHEIYGVRWTLKTNADGLCEILMGYPAQEVSHIFEYGFEGGLLSVQRQVQSTDIRNRLLGRGGSKNLPYRYFKDKDPNNPLFDADPDWIPELANISFTELRGKTFRDYVRGWKAKRYGGTPMAEPTEAYLAGYNAEKFDPIEYVDDKESIEKYGVLVGALENNEEIYPSIQGAPGDVDMIVDAEQVVDDDIDASVNNDAIEYNIEGMSYTQEDVASDVKTSIIISDKNARVYFSVPEGKKGTINTPSFTATGRSYSNFYDEYKEVDPGLINIDRDECSFVVKNKVTGEEVSHINIPPGEYYYEATVVVSHIFGYSINITANISAIHLVISADNESLWSNTFDIWVRNIWGSTRNSEETDQQYADRVWLPILGDRLGNEARVVFSSGWLSFSSAWEFPIVGYAYDDSKTDSHWRLTLAKSEAELEASGKYIPYEGYNASAGDRFFFIGIDMTHEYVLWGEERVDDHKHDSLLLTAEIKPAWVIKTDKVRLNADIDGIKLIDSLSVGSQIRLASKQFIDGVYENLYVQSLTYSWTTDTILYPDIEVVVSDKVATVKNPVAQMQGNIENLQRQVGSLSNIQQIIRQVCDQLYLRKDGVEDISKSPTRFLGKVTGEKFRQGQIGGRDWGIYRDENGNAIFETDKLVARQGIVVSDLIVNEATYVGGLQINSAAAMKTTAVEDTDAGYVCYFDQKQGSVRNKFLTDDVALCQKFDAENNEVKFYKRRVIAITDTSITLSKTDVNGTGIPAIDDEIIHYGNYTNATRQFVIIRDVIGGGYERMLMGLNSVNSDGVEYYFAGKTADSKARWFVGSTEQYAKYENGQFTIKGNFFVTGSDKSINEQIGDLDFIKNAFGDGAQGLILGTAIIVGYNDNEGNFVPMAGMSGIFDKDSENGGPAAWYGGTPENAKSVIFMDGTGYFADGLFKWDDETGVNLGNDAIKLNYDGSVEFGEGIKIGTEGDETLGTILTSLTAMGKDVTSVKEGLIAKLDKALFDTLFAPHYNEDGELESIEAKVGFWSTKFISARTSDPEAGGGSGGGDVGKSYLNELLDVNLLASALTTGDMLMWDSTRGKYTTINRSELGSGGGGGSSVDESDPIFTNSPAFIISFDDINSWNSKTSNIGTITGIKMNGVSKGTSGVVDLGTVITEHQSLADYALKSDIPLALKNPNALSWSGYNSGSYDGSSTKSFVIPTSLPASDVYAWAKAVSKPSYTKSEVGLGNVDNTADADKSVNYAKSAGYATSAGSAPASDVYAWAKASSKPSYNTSEVTESGNLYFTNARAVSALSETLKGYQPLSTAINTGNIGSQSVNYANTAGSCNGNAASATKLQTARTIWGQSFNGTGNVSGAMTGVTTIDASDTIYSAKGLYTAGFLSARTSSSSSDKKLKKNIRPIKGALDYVLGTNYVSFDWKQDGKHSVGVIAQEELDRECSFLVEKNGEHYTYNYAQHVALVGQALKEEHAKVVELEQKVAYLEEKLNELLNR